MSDKEKENILICSAWPYASGMPHLGNIQTSLLSGDVFSRYYRLKGHPVLYVSGSDAHGTRIEFEAEKRGIEPEELANETHEKIIEILEDYRIRFDNYTITTNPTHKEFVREIHRQMEEEGYIFSSEEERAYCHDCQRFLADRFIEGTCPECGAKGAHGNQCDSCGSLLEPEELVEPKCAICGSDDIEFKNTRHWYIDLPKLQPSLEEYVKRNYDDWQDNVKRFTDQMLKDGLEPRAITRDIDWGISAPFEGAEDKVIYVWAEAALGYVSATMEYFQDNESEEDWKDYWLSEDTTQVYTLAKDNIPFHTLLFPGQLLASGQGYHLPDQISAGEYLNWVGGKSFSKSKGVGLFVDDATDLMDPVFWRFYLMFQRPEKKDVEFSWSELDKAVNNIFIDNVSNFVNRVTSFTYSRYEGDIPEGSVEKKIDREIKETVTEVEKIIESGGLSSALREICDLANYGNRYFQDREPWETGDKDVITSSLKIAKAISVMLEPFVPSFSKQVYEIFELSDPSWKEIRQDPSGKLSEPEPLLEKQNVKELRKKYKEKIANKNRKEEDKPKMSKSEISFEDFNDLDMRTGKIKEVKEVPGADNLYKLQIDVGKEELQTVSGLKNHYEAEELQDKLVIVLTNLEPATILGEKSECMLLAAEGDNLSLLTADKELDPGAEIS
ncbi:methionine--tRNA ligase [Candidatus Bipolaricaulota bacterium]|nr:methionine--tRNA ligase [Candidatus Bipolaricaulota bacterium]